MLTVYMYFVSSILKKIINTRVYQVFKTIQ